MEAVLLKIRDFVDQAHGSQKRKYSDERYIVHPVRVMNICRTYDGRLPILAAALLHDVLEDTRVKENEILDFLLGLMPSGDAAWTIAMVVELTDVYIKPDYPNLNRRRRKQLELDRIIQTSPEAQTIKYADILDNCSEIVANDRDFAPRLLNECRAILLHSVKGNPDLHQVAIEKIDTELARISR